MKDQLIIMCSDYREMREVLLLPEKMQIGIFSRTVTSPGKIPLTNLAHQSKKHEYTTENQKQRRH